MKNKYKKFMSYNRRFIKTCINDIKKLNNAFYLSNDELDTINFLTDRLKLKWHSFNMIFNTNLSYTKFINMFD